MEKGSVKQRALLLANHLAEVNIGGKGFLTDEEFDALSSTFKTPQDITVYNRYRKMFDRVQIYLTYISQFRTGYMEVLGRLDKLILLRKSNSDFEELSNRLIDLMPSPSLKEKAISIVQHYSNVSLLRSFSLDEEGYIQVEDTKQFDESIAELQLLVRQEQVRLKTGLAVIKDYLNETQFNVRVFWGYIKEVENWAKSKKGLSFLLSDRASRKFTEPTLRPFFEKHSLEKDYDSVEIDKKKYDKFRQEYLNV